MDAGMEIWIEHKLLYNVKQVDVRLTAGLSDLLNKVIQSIIQC
jgi:hypothetical protein